MTGRNMNIYFREETYNKIKNLISRREVSRFINEAVEEKLQKKEERQKEELKKKLIAAYQRQAKNKKLQKELRAMEAAQFEDLGKDE